MGSLRFSITLLTVQVLFSLLILKSYLISIKDHDRYITPHILMLASISCQVLSQLLLTVHLWYYAIDGEGFTIMQVFSSIIQGFSEVIMSALLMMMANGWTVLY